MAKKVLLFGYTGKLGRALHKALAADFEVIAKNTSDFDAMNFASADRLIDEFQPDIIVNPVAYLGIDACEQNPYPTSVLNTLFPQHLARRCAETGAAVVQFSTESVFSGKLKRAVTEDDIPDPINNYGFTKYMSEVTVRDTLEAHYIFRLPVLFGENPRRNQFVEKMLDMARNGKDLRIADDIITAPTYAKDAAERIAQMLKDETPFGLYHMANEGQATLFDLMSEAVKILALPVKVARASLNDFPSVGAKNTITPLKMTKASPLRPWQEALQAYCGECEG